MSFSFDDGRGHPQGTRSELADPCSPERLTGMDTDHSTAPGPEAFTEPPPEVQAARLALARLERGLHRNSDPLAPSVELDCVAMAFLALEAVTPPYPPLPPVEPSADPATDLTEALARLAEAGADADSAAAKLRYAFAARDLTELDTVTARRS